MDENPYEIGDILHWSWGYDQTNATFFQVVAVTPKTIVVRRIRVDYTETSFMSGRKTPRPGEFTTDSQPMRKRVQFTRDGKPFISFPYGWCGKWDGEPKFTSSYA